MTQVSPSTVGIVGGGLAGLAAATSLCGRGILVELFEARRRLGGRAGSFRDPDTGQWLDHCQHVNLGCCVNYAAFCRHTGVAHLVRRYRRLHFFGPDGRRYDVRACRGLPAPLHLAPALLRLGFLDWAERWTVLRDLGRLARRSDAAAAERQTMGDWLRARHRSPRVIDRFWSVVLVSALSESVDRVSLAAARKVFVDGFMASPAGYVVELPTVPLDQLYQRVADWLRQRGALVHCAAPVQGVVDAGCGAAALRVAGELRPFDAIIVAVPWRRLPILLGPALSAAAGIDTQLQEIAAAPISSLHLWWDRPITALPHAVLVGRLSQWVFARPPEDRADAGEGPHRYQVVISNARQVVGRRREEVLAEVLHDLRAVFPAAAEARLLRWRLVNQPEAVFSMRPGLEAVRPAQATRIASLFLAGDWTRTGWPATMEGAVRSGYLAAEAVLRSFGRPASLVLPEPRSWLTRGWR